MEPKKLILKNCKYSPSITVLASIDATLNSHEESKMIERPRSKTLTRPPLDECEENWDLGVATSHPNSSEGQ